MTVQEKRANFKSQMMVLPVQGALRSLRRLQPGAGPAAVFL